MAVAMKLMKGAISWIIAGVVSSAIAVVAVSIYSKDSKPCSERRCFSELDVRIAALEASMKARTADRYTGTDAKRDLLIINRRIDSIHAEQKDKR